MSRSTKVVNKTVKDPELIGMFNKMVGASDPDPYVIEPKFESIWKCTNDVLILLGKLYNSPCTTAFGQYHEAGFKQIAEFIEYANPIIQDLQLEKNDKIYTGSELNAINSDPSKLTAFLQTVHNKYKPEQLIKNYKKLKECGPVKEMIMIARNLKASLVVEMNRRHVKIHDLEHKDNLSDNFIVNSDGDFLQFFGFSKLDFKQIFISDKMTPEIRKYILIILHHMYNRVLMVVKETTSPDIDIDKFSEIMVENINDMRRYIPRCGKAFDKISKSVGLLKEKFGSYYRDFITSQNHNPGIIIENFVLDVAENSKADMETYRQFKQIIGFYKNRMQSACIEDPQLRKMFSLVEDNLDILDSKMSKKTKKAEEQKEESKTGEEQKEKDEKNDDQKEKDQKSEKNNDQNEENEKDDRKEKNEKEEADENDD